VEPQFQRSKIGEAGREILWEIIEKNPKNSLNIAEKDHFTANFSPPPGPQTWPFVARTALIRVSATLRQVIWRLKLLESLDFSRIQSPDSGRGEAVANEHFGSNLKFLCGHYRSVVE
jgi:hypothetical protein